MDDGRPRVLVVEDNVIIAMEIEFLAGECGCAVVGPAGSVNEALNEIGEAEIEGAILDINLGDERIWPLAEYLTERQVPFVLATGYGLEEVPDSFKNCVILSKPISRAALQKALKEIGTVRA